MKKPEEDTSVIKEKAVIYSKPKNEYEERVNEAAISLALKDPNLILGRGKLFCLRSLHVLVVLGSGCQTVFIPANRLASFYTLF